MRSVLGILARRSVLVPPIVLALALGGAMLAWGAARPDAAAGARGRAPGDGYPDAPAGVRVHAPTGVRQDAGPVYLVYFWRARPGRGAEYSAYIRDVAEPIDEDARKAGVFEEVHTYTPFLATGAPGGDWTHMRVFKLKDFAALDRFSAGMDAATARLHPSEAERQANSARSAELRDLARQEIWRDFR